MEQIKTIIYISKIRYPKYHPFWFIFYMYLAYYRVYKRKYEYILKPVSSQVILNYLKDRTEYFCDINNTVIVKKKNVYQCDRLLRLRCIKNAAFRNVYVIPSSCCVSDVLLISEALYHNLMNSGFSLEGKLEDFNRNFINFADELELSMINGPSDINNATIDAILDGYFKIPKLIYQGDILEISIKEFAESIFYTNSKINGIGYVYFKCNKVIFENKEVVKEGFYCAIGQTAVKQTVNIQSLLPKKVQVCTRSACNGKTEVFEQVPMCPYGLGKCFEKIETSVKPFIIKKNLNLKPVFSIQGDMGSGKEILLNALASKLGVHFYRINNSDLCANVYAQNETKLNNAFFTAKMSAPCIISIHNFENFGKNNEGQYDERLTSYFIDRLDYLFEKNPFPVVLFCCSNEKTIPADLKRVFLETFEIAAPSDVQRADNLRWILEVNDIPSETIDLSEIANRTHGFSFEDLKALVYYAEMNFKKSTRDVGLEQEDFLQAVEYMQSTYSESIGAPKVPKVQWSDVGGLANVKNEIIKTIDLPLKHPDLFKSSGLKRSGILLFGPPGTGKTLLAKAVATECSLCFLSVKGPELLNMYVGQSEQNVREVFEKARQASPCIIFFDELDSLAPNRGMSGDSGGVMDRVVSQLLAEMDGLNESGTIFIIGATNRPDLIDPALLRPGRFDKLLYVGPCTDFQSKTSVLKALTRKFVLSDDVSLENVVKICPDNITGADFYGICSSAWSCAAQRLIAKIQQGEMFAENLTHQDVAVNFEDFKVAIKNVKPSISREDLLYFEKLGKELG